ncbi:MAG: U32 family peptidase, partial [Candidatus Aureabacteria bacterium]|nr:U32 family peptidase [Candidatus Auribacterota bacterium]
RTIELSAPARTADIGIAAIDCGADAVYIGARKFGARAAAGNELAEIRRLVEYAHRFRARVYVTLNTILHDHELEEARAIINEVYDAGADALIIQDMGLLEMELPPLPLFASTQTHNATWQKVKFLEEAGFRRVILARELALDQIWEIRSKTRVELECFVAGALCVCYSGQCCFSAAVCGRSANRGECAQPCRGHYSLEDGEGNLLARNRHLLSLKDLDLSPYLERLAGEGISSFKIEGRLKDAAYVKNMTAFYRSRLDEIIARSPDLAKSSRGTIDCSFTPDPRKTFYRGATTYFIEGGREGMASLDTPKSVGEEVGTAGRVQKTYFTIRGDERLHNGDGICFFDRNRTLRGTNINRVEGDRVYARELRYLRPGAVVYRNMDHEFCRALARGGCSRTIPIRLEFGEEAGGFFVSAVDDEGTRVSAAVEAEKIPARNEALALTAIKEHCSKTGDSIYAVTDVAVSLKRPYLVPVRALNQARRELVRILDAERAKKFVRRTARVIPNDYPYPETGLDYRGNVLNGKALAFYRRHGVRRIDRACEAGGDARGKAIMTTRYCVRRELGICPRGGPRRAADAAGGSLYLVDAHRKYRLDFDCGECMMNIVFLG